MAGRRKTPPLSAPDFSRWKLVAQFQERLGGQAGEPTGRFADSRRQLGEEQYWGLMLFGLLNPVVESLRGLCAASRLQRVQADSYVLRLRQEALFAVAEEFALSAEDRAAGVSLDGLVH